MDHEVRLFIQVLAFTLLGIALLWLLIDGYQYIKRQLSNVNPETEEAMEAARQRRLEWLEVLDKEAAQTPGVMSYPERHLALKALTRLDELDMAALGANLPAKEAFHLSAQDLPLRSSELLVTLLVRTRRLQRSIALPTEPDWTEVQQLTLEVSRVALLLNTAAARALAIADAEIATALKKLDAQATQDRLEGQRRRKSANKVKAGAA